MKKQFNFTKKAIDALPIPEKGKRDYYYDEYIEDLGICVTSTGHKSFFVYRKIAGRPERILIGKYPDITIFNARAKVPEIRAQIVQGKNPNQEKRNLKAESTLEQLFERYIEQAKTHKKSWQGDCNLYNYYLSEWKYKRISAISREDIIRKHTVISKDHGKYAANRMLSLIRAMYNRAINDLGWDNRNPAIGIKKNPEKTRDRFLHGDELQRFFQTLNEELNQIFKDYFLICLLTGARKTNVLAMRWSDINFERKVWKIEETKNGEAHTIPLSERAIEILKQRLEDKVDNWVFHSYLSKSGHLEEPKSAWTRILKQAEINDLRIHDLRRTLGSWQAVTGASSYIIGKSLGHKDQKSTAVYARLHLDPVRESIEKATDAMFLKQNNIVK